MPRVGPIAPGSRTPVAGSAGEVLRYGACEGLLLVGVEEMTDERAAELVSGNLDFRRASNGTLTSAEDAVRKLLGRAHVRGAFGLKFGSPTAALAW